MAQPARYIRWAHPIDLPRLAEIDESSFGDPWTEDVYRRVHSMANHVILVMECANKVVGHLVYEDRKRSLYIQNIVVDADYRRQGVATALVDYAKTRLFLSDKSSLTVVVDEHNMRAIKFWQRQGFAASSVLRDHFEDALDGALSDGYKFRFQLADAKKELTHGQCN